MMEKVILARKVHFNCGHRYFNPNFSDEKNREVFGSCYSEHGHGHNYTLEAYVRGQVSPDTGMVMNLKDLDQILKKVTDTLDHKFLNEDVEDFQALVPTTENIGLYCFRNISTALKSLDIKLEKVRLYENENLWVDLVAGLS